jgi:hypothetical protein
MNWTNTPDSTGDVMYGTFGNYYVGDKTFYNNSEAFIESNRTNKKVTWQFYDDVFKQAHDLGLWRNMSLDTLYVQRARQLRAQYEHITVLYSGGWDSQNILNIFEREGIHIDAIAIYVVPELDTVTSADSLEAENWYSEIKYAALPFARAFCSRNPNTKLIEIPWIETTINAYLDSDIETLYKESRTKPGFWFGRHITLSRHPELLKDVGNKNGCVLQGIDKPCIIHNDMQSALGFFPEGLLRICAYPRKSMGYQENQTWEFFYWTPNLPELAIRGWYELLILCKQDPLVYKAHSSSTSLHDRFDLKMSRYVQDAIKQLLYQYFDPKMWQCHKQSEWGFHMSIEGPLLKILDERGIKWQQQLGEILRQLPGIVGEDNLIIGARPDYNSAAHVSQVLSDSNTVLDYRSIHGQFIDLDMSFIN